MDIGDLRDRKYDVGNCSLFIADPYWAGDTNLFASGGPLRWRSRVQYAVGRDDFEAEADGALSACAKRGAPSSVYSRDPSTPQETA